MSVLCSLPKSHTTSSGGLPKSSRYRSNWLYAASRFLVLPFVFPAEMVLHPDVGPTLGAPSVVNAALERVPRAIGIGRGRLGLAEKLAQIEKVLPSGAAFR